MSRSVSRHRGPPTPPLATVRLDLVPLRVTHAAALFPLLADRRIYRYIPGRPPASVARLRARFKRYRRGPRKDVRQRWYNWVVRRRADGACLGTVQSTVEIDSDRAFLGYVIGRAYWGKGYASEAARALVGFLRRVEHVRTIDAIVDRRNHRSVRLLRRLGLQRVPVAERGKVEPDFDPHEELYRRVYRSGARRR